MASVQFIGLDHLIRAFGRISIATPEMAARVLYKGVSGVLQNSLRVTPIDTGALRSSGHVGSPDVTLAGATVEVGYGTPDTGTDTYALIVHENEAASHNPPTGPHYLSRPAYDDAPKIIGELQAGLESLLAEAVRL